MILKKIELQNFKTIEDFSQEFKDGVYLVTGENEIGKSTLLGAITTLLTGDRSDNLLKKGKEKGYAKTIIGDDGNEYTVELRFSEKNPRGTLTIETKDGMRDNRISALQAIFNYQDFDAHEFTQWSTTAEGRRKQVALVESLLPEAGRNRLEKIGYEVERLKAERKDYNSTVRVYESNIKSSGVSEDDIKKYSSPIAVQPIIDEKTEAVTLNANREKVGDGIKEREQILSNFDEETQKIEERQGAALASLQEELDRIKAKIAEAENEKRELAKNRDRRKKAIKQEISEADKWLETHPEQDIEKIQKKIDEADSHNAKHNKVREHLSSREKLTEAAKEAGAINKKLEALASERETIILESDLPIKGLTFNEDGLQLNGVPFRPGEVSTSQEMEVAVKLAIAKNKNVQLFKIAQGESLGGPRLKAIVEFAKKNGYQGFIEEVKRGQTELIVTEFSEK